MGYVIAPAPEDLGSPEWCVYVATLGEGGIGSVRLSPGDPLPDGVTEAEIERLDRAGLIVEAPKGRGRAATPPTEG
ncbi:hypothetical protein GCM10022215_18060 [Nocardioides fonticola]|uniref:Uncharacterized protein n=1 Tax=Nocardioides fonticola TaxID=450363 RepID=A0ABP7XK97_9ACTN